MLPCVLTEQEGCSVLREKSGKNIVKITPSRRRSSEGPQTGWLVVANGDVCVDYPGNPHPPLAARTITPIDQRVLEDALRSKKEVLLLFEGDQSDRPIILGFVESLDAKPKKGEAVRNDRPVGLDGGVTTPYEAVVDGKRIVLDAQNEIELRCGSASITLRRNGRVVIQGTYVETHSRGVNRIKGGSVQIN